MHADLLNEVLPRLKRDFSFEPKGTYLRKGRCPDCKKREMYARAEAPWVLRCGRLDRCGTEIEIKTRYPDIFEDWSKRYPRSERAPHAAADAYLAHGRGFDLQKLRGHYTEEYYKDSKTGMGSATVRFQLACGVWWERLIDQPQRFGKMKARFSYEGTYAGHVWTLPHLSLEQYADAAQIWFAEGIFDTIGLNQGAGLAAASTMSSNNYPAEFLKQIHAIIAARGPGARRPKLIFAYDVGRAGVEFTRDFVERARGDGWECGAAQVRPDGEGHKRDWNDLFIRKELTPEKIEEYLWNGDVTIAATAPEKAFLLYSRDRYATFPFTFRSKQLWAEYSLARIEERVMEMGEDKALKELTYEAKWDMAARDACEIHEIANCTFHALYWQHDEAIDDSAYYFRVDFPGKQKSIKSTFTGASIAAGAEFKKRLISIAPGAIWTGSTGQLDRIMQRQLVGIKTVEAIQFTGYSIDHGAYVLGDIGVKDGRVYQPNAEDYFDFGKTALKLRSAERVLAINYDAEKLDLRWAGWVITAYGPKGLVALAFFFGSLFAEQIRREQKSLAFLEMTGDPGTGKTTLLEFLWRLLGRDAYEGFDPAKATAAAIARNLGKVANLPVVLLEGDRTQEVPHSRRFEWDELKTAYNGRSVRARGVANGGMETFEPPFRASIVIAQNAPVEASAAMHERIMAIHFDKAGWSPQTKAAAEKLEATATDDVSGFIIHALRREADVMKAYRAAFAQHEQRMAGLKDVRNGRLVKNHAQLAAMFDAMRLIVTNINDRDAAAVQDFMDDMLVERQRTINKDHPDVILFWERFDWLNSQIAADSDNPINHSRDPDKMIAINLVQFEQKCGDNRLSLPRMNDLKKLLKTSKERKFAGSKPINSRTGKSVFCWCFEPAPTHR
ncbi:toprim domain-containing protein [Sphingomonas cavernae]|uniref:Bifunctional DNA primase/helicase n=1 Tax=Sphingomonas cavernae TaxID=2320861 RepID=A0A418WP40_9SPHN|nr:toprim domain-containing protein [Sphingomonas cavernae]RJF93008.1 bifunctional DNA primase/helicase [Sphingomonas cavernae]